MYKGEHKFKGSIKKMLPRTSCHLALMGLNFVRQGRRDCGEGQNSIYIISLDLSKLGKPTKALEDNTFLPL